MNLWIINILRIIHILASAFWLGAALMNTGFISPTVRALGPAGGQFMRHIVQVRRLPDYINSAAALSVLSGIALYAWRSGGFQDQWMMSRSGLVFGLGGLLATVALITGYFLIGRTVARLGQLAASAAATNGPPPPEVSAEMQRLQGRMSRASMAAAILIVAATICMAVGRYL